MLRGGRAQVNLRASRKWARRQKGGAEAPPLPFARRPSLFPELPRPPGVVSVMPGRFDLHLYFATLCAPAFVIALFVIYLFLKDRNRRL
jgi:hypothetical protein